MNSVRINKGKQNPNIFTKLHTYLQSYSKSINVMFTEDSAYELPAGEQADWNKLIGRKAFIRTNGSLNPLDWEFGRFEQFWVWRKYEGEYQVAKYVRENDKFWWFMERTANEGWWKTLDLTWFTYLLPSGSYFGGNNHAPNRVYYHVWVP